MRCGVRLEFDAIVDHDFGHGHRAWPVPRSTSLSATSRPAR
jgi:hypothetical protein